MKTSNIVLIVVGFLTVIFTIAMIYIYWTHCSIPDTLVTCWFSAFAGECGVLGWIKTAKVKSIERQQQLEDYERFKKEEK